MERCSLRQTAAQSGSKSKKLTDFALTGVTFTTEKKAIVVGYRGTILQTEDGGETWTMKDALVTTDLYTVFFTDEMHGWAAGDSGVVLTTGDGGNIWLPVNVRTGPKLATLYLLR